MASALTRAEALAAQAKRATERDQIQANLLELDASFGKRLLDGGSLTGTTTLRWDAASADLASNWATFTGYAEVIRRAGELLDRTRFPGAALLASVSKLLTGPAVRVSGPLAPQAAAQVLLDRHRELRGLLDAYRAKGARHGAAENIELAALYRRARDLLRAAPCDLPAASDEVRLYQRAVLGLSGGTP